VARTPNLRRRGFWFALGLNLFLAVLYGFLATKLSIQPTDSVLQSLAQIGATLLIAYAVETSWAVKASGALSSD
jgi:hypothetical protein